MAKVFGTDASEQINGLDGVTDGSDGIFAGGGNDTIFGLGGNDIIYGGSGADDIHGGSGSDTSSYHDSNEGVVVSLSTGQGFFGYAEGDTLTSIENLFGSWYDDLLIGNDDDNGLVGGGGDDTLVGGGGADMLYGDGGGGPSGDDTLKGGGGADTLNGGGGNDTASYEGSDARVLVSLRDDFAAGGDAEGDELNSIENLIGSAHHDMLSGNDSVNVLRGNDGDDTLKGYGGADTIFGGNQNDSLYGMDGVDTLRGENGNDMLNGGAGDDTMIGGTGNDSYYVDSASDTVTEFGFQGTTDTVYSTANAYTLSNFVEILSLDTDTDTGVYGTGNARANTIFGNVNDNILEGGGGADTFNGLGGNDNFVFRPGDANGDVIHEFAGNGAGVGDFMYFIGYGTIAQGATFHQLTATTWEISSADGLTHDTITFAGGPAIDAGDFVFI